MTNLKFECLCKTEPQPVTSRSVVGWTLYCPACETLAVENYQAHANGRLFYVYNVKPEEKWRKAQEAAPQWGKEVTPIKDITDWYQPDPLPALKAALRQIMSALWAEIRKRRN